MDSKIIKIHFVYIIFILVSIIVVLSTKNFGNNKELVNYISFAGTIASILLAIVSIIYAFYSNNQLSQTLGKLDNTSQSLNDSSQKVKDISEQLSSEVQKLTNTIDSIPNSIESMKEKVIETNSLIQSSLINTQDISEGDASQQSKLLSLPSAGILALYIACLSKENNKILESKTGIKHVDTLYLYILGCISCLKALEYLSIDNKIKATDGFLVTDLDNEINNNLQKIKDMLEKKRPGLKQQIEEYFNK